ncbi:MULTISPECIES: hypothetical protein [unclassified Tolypothrix]|uniref:hypothetical protein n=1 Tax=unclassified Tolypothrix TaxID=2649714 RepID=UPI0005EAA200|nr:MULTISPECIES: hypothetical protein [unclassified Tolypothrix]BAY95911.1 hypothetical protein NIES3275_79880 [Microchaete diplosiphon NIES-3275]EKE96553.1 hypothetical protein FDUTEX481_06562 [Tolypothrix sp. PCC 7601]MBE9084713.1 hypothetical protein [Tolypothrix sp. LEGE 11397]UYD30938.1 hypothetical protein HGR01_39460 [Tolypothrix sp. PCC 7712]UYD38800.1 hypothetical protein HG267_40620 [Tolypothrix sp. PCC 7601]
MTFWFGIGIMQLIPKEYDDYYPDEILNCLVDKLESELADDVQIREVLMKAGVDLYTRAEPTDRPTVIASSINSGGELPDRIALPILTAIQNVETVDYAPYEYCSKMPDPIADILIPGFGKRVQSTEATQQLLYSRIKLEDFCVTPLKDFWVGGLEQHLAAFTEWRDSLYNEADFVPRGRVSREEILEFYDEHLLPMLRFCNDYRLIFVFGF